MGGKQSTASATPPSPPPPATAPPPPATIYAPPKPPMNRLWDDYGTHHWSILFHVVSADEYPQVKQVEHIGEMPGLALVENSMMQGIRVAVPIGFCLAPILWTIHRKRLPFADRELVKLHHYVIPSAGYATPIGAFGGLLSAVWEARTSIGPARPDKAAERKLVAAAVVTRTDATSNRWASTAARLSFYGIFFMVFGWKGGSAPFRMSMGTGLGVCLASVVSALKIDRQLELTV